jgi:hypothetical protein
MPKNSEGMGGMAAVLALPEFLAAGPVGFGHNSFMGSSKPYPSPASPSTLSSAKQFEI